MRKTIATSFKSKQQRWARLDPHYLALAELDALLDGKFYDGQAHAFYKETTEKGKYIPVTSRRPSFRFNLYNMVADQIARKLFGGRHAPALVHPDEKIRKQLDALKEECKLESKMVEAAHWGSIGSVCTIFQIVPFTIKQKGKDVKKSKVVVKNVRSRFCTPTFNKLDELSRLRVHWPVMGSDYLSGDIPVTEDWEGEKIKGDSAYWWIQEWNADKETIYKPIKIEDWAPYDVKSEKLVVSEEISHGLGFVPAHWHQFRTGEIRPYDGKCYWEPAVDNIIDLDYTVSQIGSGVRYNSVPQVVVKGEVINAEADGALGRGASRFIQIKHDVKEGEVEEKNSDVFMLEAKGEGMRIGLEHWASLVLRLAMQQICASLKDPNKVTTAMSGKGMEVLESEFLDLAQELRTVFGDDGYLKLLKKIAVACSLKNHSLLENITIEQIDALTFGWPPLTSIGMVEFNAMALGLAAMIKAEIWNAKEARDFSMGQIDMPVNSANKDYLPSVQTNVDSDNKDSSIEKDVDTTDEDEKKAFTQTAEIIAQSGITMIDRGLIDTHTLDL